jgi:uncharacterized protein YneF (UPF0154 family)
MSLGVKIGLGAGIPIALVVGIGAGFFLFSRRKKKDDMNMAEAPPYRQHEYRQESNGYYGSNMAEAPAKSPVEMDPNGNPFGTYRDHEGKRSPDGSVEPVRYEM